MRVYFCAILAGLSHFQLALTMQYRPKDALRLSDLKQTPDPQQVESLRVCGELTTESALHTDALKHTPPYSAPHCVS
jgi:hypothetical protein